LKKSIFILFIFITNRVERGPACKGAATLESQVAQKIDAGAGLTFKVLFKVLDDALEHIGDGKRGADPRGEDASNGAAEGLVGKRMGERKQNYRR